MKIQRVWLIGLCVILVLSGICIGWLLNAMLGSNQYDSAGIESEVNTDSEKLSEQDDQVQSDSNTAVDDSNNMPNDAMDNVNNTSEQDTVAEDPEVEQADTSPRIQLTTESVKETLGLDQEYSIVALSPDLSKAAYIDVVTFEALGNAYLYEADTKKVTPITQLTYDQVDTAKKIVWLDSDTIAIIIGYRNGTITQGGNIYTYRLSSKTLKLSLSADEKTEFVDINVYEDTVLLRTVKWIDDNLTQYIYEDLSLETSELLKE